jgi:hypothetical protein
VAVWEERANLTVTLPQGFAEIDRRTYGETQFVLACYEG